MSVSQVKKQFEELSLYLGRDTAGQEKLKKLKDAVNVVRNRLAVAEEKEASASGAASQSMSMMRELQRQVDDLKTENHSLRQVVQGLRRELEAASVAIEECQDDADGIEQLAPEIKRALKSLRDKLKFCPKPKRRILVNADPAFVFDRESIAKGWSHESLWTLGAAMATLVSLEGVVVLETNARIRDLNVENSGEDESLHRPLIRWFKNCIQLDDSQRMAGFVMVNGCKPGFIPECHGMIEVPKHLRHMTDCT